MTDGLAETMWVEIPVPKSILQNSPSKKDGITEDIEIEHRIWGCELIQEAGILLRLPQVAMVTGQTLLHRFYYRQSLREFDAFKVAMACIFLAAKIEEMPKRTREVLNVFNRIYQCRKDLPKRLLEVGGERHTLWKDSLIKVERQILIDLGFCLYKLMIHPHTFILYYVKALKGSSELSQLSWNYLNDSLRLDLSVRYKSEVIACAAIYMAARQLSLELPENPPWWEPFDATEDEILEVALQVLQLYKRRKIVWLDPLTDHNPYIDRTPDRAVSESPIIKKVSPVDSSVSPGNSMIETQGAEKRSLDSVQEESESSSTLKKARVNPKPS